MRARILNCKQAWCFSGVQSLFGDSYILVRQFLGFRKAVPEAKYE
jgi:hypothetical protein